MPNRYIRESAIESERVNALSWQGEVFYRRLLNRADDFGRFTANHALLRASLFPLQLDKVSEADVARLLKEAEANGLLGTYGADEKRFLVISKWEKGRAKESRYPKPPEELCERLQTYVCTSKHPQTHAPDSDSDSDSDSDPDKRNTPPRGGWIYPRLEEVLNEASMRGVASQSAEAFYHHFEGQGWVTKDGQPITNWRSKLAAWWARDQERKTKDTARPPRASGRTIGTSTPDDAKF